MIPKSDKLASESSVATVSGPSAYTNAAMPAVHGDERAIKQLYPLNDMVALWQEAEASSIMLTDRDKYKNEGVVVGVGPTVTQVAVGDVVLFPDRANMHIINTDGGFYKGERIILMTERNFLMKLRSIKIELV
jgi:hypothetical protein